MEKKEKKPLLSKPNANRVDIQPIKNTVSRKDFLKDETPVVYSGIRLTKENTTKLNVLTKMKKHSSVNDFVNVLLEVYVHGELSDEEKESFNIMLKYMK